MFKTPLFQKLRCRKSGRRCGAKCVSKSKCEKYRGLGTFLEVEMLKKSAGRSGAKQISKSKCENHTILATFLEAENAARSIFRSQNVTETSFLEHFQKLRCSIIARLRGTKAISKSKAVKKN